MNLQLSSELNDILTYAKEEAMRLGNYTVSTDHLVLGILRHRENITVETLASLGVNVAELKVHLENAVMAKEPIPIDKENMLSLSKASENALKIMFLEARSLHTIKPDSSHLFLAILRAQDGNAVQYLESTGITYDRIREIIAQNENEEKGTPSESTPAKEEDEKNLPDSLLNAGDNDDVLENRKGENHREEKILSPAVMKYSRKHLTGEMVKLFEK